MKIIKSLRFLIKGIAKIIKRESKEQRGGFRGTLIGKYGADLLGNLLTGKGVKR